MEEEKVLEKTETAPAAKPAYLQFLLPGSIVLAALLISGTIFFTRNSGNGTADIGDKVKPANIKIAASDHVLGNEKAKVTIVEYADFRCPFCERFYTDTEKQIIADYVDTGKAKFVFRNFAFLGQQSVWASEAAECAAEQGKYWDYYNWLFSNQAPESDLNYYSKANLIKYAGKVSLDTAQFTTCLNSDKTAQKVSDDLNSGKAIGVTGTPTIFVNGNKIVGAQPYATFKQQIDAILK